MLLRRVIDKEKNKVSWKKGKLVKRDENDICDLSFENKDISSKYFKKKLDNEVRSKYNLITKLYL